MMAADDLTTVERRGYCAIFTVEGNRYRFETDAYPELAAALDRGAAWFTGMGCSGQMLTVKLARVECLVVWTPASLIADREEDAEIASRKLLTGED